MTSDPVETSRPASHPLLAMRNVRKSFAAGEVLHGVDFALARGEIHALVGQNGAGKSTLMKVLGGVYADYAGEIRIEGEPFRFHSPRSALDHGVAVIYQDFALVPNLTVADNIALGREPRRWMAGFVDHAQIRKRSESEAAALGIELPMDSPVRRLGVAEQQLTEVVKAISRDARILVMDEPTARLSPGERDRLFAIMRRLKERGVGIVYISHFLEEVFAVADRVTVLRDGSLVATRPCSELDLRQLATLMVGALLESGERAGVTRGEERQVLELRDFSVSSHPPMSVSLGAGEILGIAGLVGSGRTRLARAIVGDVHAGGQLALDGVVRRFHSPLDAANAGLLLLPEDRKRDGLILPSSVGANVVLSSLSPRLSRHGVVQRASRRRLIARLIDRFRILPPDPERAVRTLSGGNQQKVLLARAFAAEPHVLVLDQPTAGVDVGAKAEIYDQVTALARAGVGIILISDDLDELLLLSHRVLVMRAGQLVGVREAHAFTRTELLEAITTGRMGRAA